MKNRNFDQQNNADGSSRRNFRENRGSVPEGERIQWIDIVTMEQFFHFSRRTQQRLRSSRELMFYKVAHKIFYNLRDVDEFILSHPGNGRNR